MYAFIKPLIFALARESANKVGSFQPILTGFFPIARPKAIDSAPQKSRSTAKSNAPSQILKVARNCPGRGVLFAVQIRKLFFFIPLFSLYSRQCGIPSFFFCSNMDFSDLRLTSPTAMVLPAPFQRDSSPPSPPDSILTDSELSDCLNAKEQCRQLLTVLQSYRQEHCSEGAHQQHLQTAELYNMTLQHLDAACDGLFAISQK